ncbi:hypothetical protein KKE60_08005 [Patescibacteria group bacterium]|nr:hypothetical protein [Patescibacteria group bacterium]
MTQEELKTILEEKQINYKVKGKRIVVTYKGSVYLPSLTSLPEGTTFENKGHVGLPSLTSLSEGTKFKNKGKVYLSSLTSLPEGTKFENEGYVGLSSLTSLPVGTTFKNKGYVGLPSLTSLPEGTTFENEGGVYLPSLTSLSEGTKFKNKGKVYLSSLTSLPEGTKFKNEGHVGLPSLTSLSAGTTFENESEVYLRTFQNAEVQAIYDSLFSTQKKRIHVQEGIIKIDGKSYQAKMIDNIPMIFKKRKGNVIIGNVLKQDMTIGEKIYIIEDNGVYAHGKTIEEARESFVYKLSDRDTSAYDDMTLETTLSFADAVKMYRTITGACEFGVRHFVDENNVDKKDRTIKEIIETTKGQYGNDKLAEFFKEAK